MVVGARNLLIGSNDFKGDRVSTSSIFAIDGTYEGLNVLTGKIPQSASGVILNFYDIFPDKLGSVYTLSFYAKGTTESTIFNPRVPILKTKFHGDSGYVQCVTTEQSNGIVSNEPDGLCEWTLTDEWTRYWVTWTLADEGDISIPKEVEILANTLTTISICGCKLEKGNKPTDWLPAYEDTLKGITDAEERLTKYTIDQGADIIKNTNNVVLSALDSYVLKNKGSYIVDVVNYYFVFKTTENITVDSTNSWSTNMVSMSDAAPYLFSYEVATYNDLSTVTTEPRLLCTHTGPVLETVVEYYTIVNAKTEEEFNALEDVVWTTTIPETNGEKLYLWNYEVVRLIDGLDGPTIEVPTLPHYIGEYYPSYNELYSNSKTELQVMSDRINFNFETTKESIENIDGKLSPFVEKAEKRITFDADNGMTIQSCENGETVGTVLSVDNDGIEFSKNGEVFGSWDGVDFNTSNIIVGVNKRAQFGAFAFVPRSDGSLMFLKVGD